MLSNLFKVSTASAALIAASLPASHAADSAFTMCKDKPCDDCPTSITSSGTGYPNCVIYNSADIFTGQGYEGADGGGTQVYFDIAQPGPGCATIVKSPADTSVLACGKVIGAYRQATCSALAIKETFMVQFCCGVDDCESAGAGTTKIRGIDYRSASSLEGVTIRSVNGSTVEPIQVGYPPSARAMREKKSQLTKRSCKKDSWVAEAGKEDYTKPADDVQVVGNNLDGGTGGGQYTVTKTREQSWTNSVSASLGIEDVLSFGLSFESSFTESVSDSKAYAFSIPAGQSGKLGFTATMRCSTGHGTCNDDDTPTGELCSPVKDEDGTIVGTYAMIATS